VKITILGGGSWGTALAMHLSRKNYDIRVWEFLEDQAKEMQEERICRLLPEVRLPENIFVSSEMEKIIPKSDLILIVVPSDKVQGTISMAKEFLEDQEIIICSKGFGEENELLTDVLGNQIKNKLFCLYGPTHAEEVCKEMFSGIVLAGGEGKEILKEILESENLRVETSGDLIGVQVAAALKNILAVFVGVIEGMGLGDNAKAYVMTKGLEEIKEVGLAWGGEEETFHGLAGIGDMIVTCGSEHSRNRNVGEQIGKGRKLDEVIEEMKMVAEGVNTVKSAIKLKVKFGLKLPIITGLYEILFEGKDPKEVLEGI